MLREMDDSRKGRARMARRWIIVSLSVATVMLVGATAATATPLVSVDAKLVRNVGGAVVTGKVVWDQSAATQAPDYMSVGDLRLVAVSDHGHRPTLLATETYKRIAARPTQPVKLPIPSKDLDAIRKGNRVVLTASQHGVLSEGTRTAKTYVTVGELQRFGSAQDRIGRSDCSDVAIVPGARLDRCDLVGAFLDRALVSERKTATRMLLADLTGATMRGADLTGLSVAGGRLNGADATGAVLDNLSLAGAEATGLIASDATSDRLEGTAGGNFFDARLTDSVFTGAVLNGVSLNHAALNGANFRDARWRGVLAETTNFRGADLSGLKMLTSSVYFADFTDANLQGASLSPAEDWATVLQWTTLCRTTLPGGGQEDRDCRVGSDPGPPPVANPYVTVDGKLERQQGQATISATVTWNPAGIRSGMSAGDIRVVAIDGSTGLPTTVGSESIARGLPATTSYEATITDSKLLAALNSGNRVVLTATQHPPLPTGARDLTHRSYVKVLTLQPGPGRGQVGDRDCSNLVLSDTTPAPGGYDDCDLPGAVLTRAGLAGPMREADLTGADLSRAGLKGIVFDGAAMGGVIATGADFKSVHMIDSFAPRLTMPKTLISAAKMPAARLDEADFAGATIVDTSFATASLRRATFSDATFDKVDLGFARLPGAKLDGVEAKASRSAPEIRPSSLFLADLVKATLEDSQWMNDEAGDIPWKWATLCDTTLPDGTREDRDCPR